MAQPRQVRHNDLWRFQRVLEQLAALDVLPSPTDFRLHKQRDWLMGNPPSLILILSLDHDSQTCWFEIMIRDFNRGQPGEIISRTRYYCRPALPQTYQFVRGIDRQVAATYPDLFTDVRDDVASQLRTFGRPRRSVDQRTT